MDRGEEISGFVRKLYDALSLSHEEMRDVVQETVDWLRTSPDYRNYIDATVPGDFSLLPNEIIHDVVDSHGANMSYAHYNLKKVVQIEGSWGAFARELSAYTTQNNRIEGSDRVEFRSRSYDPAARATNEIEIPFEEARNRDMCESFVKDDDFDLDRLTAVAPKLYDDIHFDGVPGTHCKALDLMGTRFSTIKWRGELPSKPATPELVTFLRRQLRSNYLRKLSVSNVKFEDGTFDKEMAVFVSRPWFEKLSMSYVLKLPFKVIESAHKAWEAPKCCKKRVINSDISKETLTKLGDYFQTNFKFEKRQEKIELNIRHPDESNANFCLKVYDKSSWGNYQLYMDICDL